MKSRLPLIFILLTLVIDAMGIGLIMPVMPDLIRDVEGGSLSQAAIWGGILSTSFAVMQFLFGPLIGNLSDQFGRRPVLLISLGVMALDYLIMAVAGTIWLLLIGRVVGGITAATQSTAAAYVADISKPEEKSARFGLVSAAFGVGFVLGPLIGGLLGELGPRAPFYAAAALAAANMLFGYFILPETVTDRIRRPFDAKRANPLGAFKHLSRLPGLARFVLFFFLFEFSFLVYPVVWSYFTQARFGWTPGKIGLSLAVFGISMAFIQGGLIRVFLKRFGERRTVLLGLGFCLISFVALGFIDSGSVLLALIPLSALGAIVSPALQGLMSQQAEDDQQGELQGALTSVRSIAYILSPLVMTQIFSYFTTEGTPVYLPGAPFLMSAILVMVCAVVFLAPGRTTKPCDA